MVQVLIKRSYKSVSTIIAKNGVSILLDQIPVTTPDGNQLIFKNNKLVKKVVEEWVAQKEKVDISSMPLTNISYTVIDKISKNRKKEIEKLTKWASSDLLCYRALSPKELIDLQHLKWQPHLDWLKEVFSINLSHSQGIKHEEQDVKSLKAIHSLICYFDCYSLFSLIQLTKIFGSLILSLRVLKDKICWNDVFEDSQLDENWQREKWGNDQDSLKNKTLLFEEMELIKKFSSLLY